MRRSLEGSFVRLPSSCIMPGSIPGGNSVAEKVPPTSLRLGRDRFGASRAMALFSPRRQRSGSIQERIHRSFRSFHRVLDAWLTAALRSFSVSRWSEVLTMKWRPAVSTSSGRLRTKHCCVHVWDRTYIEFWPLQLLTGGRTLQGSRCIEAWRGNL